MLQHPHRGPQQIVKNKKSWGKRERVSDFLLNYINKMQFSIRTKDTHTHTQQNKKQNQKSIAPTQGKTWDNKLIKYIYIHDNSHNKYIQRTKRNYI